MVVDLGINEYTFVAGQVLFCKQVPHYVICKKGATCKFLQLKMWSLRDITTKVKGQR